MHQDPPKPPDYKRGDLCHFEIPVKDRERAKAFYGEVFGWSFHDVPDMQYTLFQTPGNVVGGGLFSPTDQWPAKVVNYLLVDSIEAAAERVKRFGGEAVSPKIEVPGHGWLMHVHDSEGNLISLWQAS
ncbi:MAG: VOC family protein [Nannocystaceae bacterium]|nr:VOC family protein [Myxococcales bacterium]